MDYKLVRDIDGTTSTTQVQRINDGAFIPFNEDNKDYKEYLKWTKASPMNIAEESE